MNTGSLAIIRLPPALAEMSSIIWYLKAVNPAYSKGNGIFIFRQLLLSFLLCTSESLHHDHETTSYLVVPL